MSERCFVKVEFDPAPSGSQVRRAINGFLRYIQHRDLHPTSKPDVAGLVKYVAYRDKASSRAELFGPEGSLGTQDRKDFVGFVARLIEGSQPQIFRTRAGVLMDRRRTVSRFLLSPESADGLDLQRLARTAVSRLESEMGVTGLRWIAAVHRNTDHHHVHLVLAGMHQDAAGRYRRVDISKARLAAMKLAIGLEIARQRGERTQLRDQPEVARPRPKSEADSVSFGREPAGPVLRTGPATHISRPRSRGSRTLYLTSHAASAIALRGVARRYQRQMQRELEQGYRQGEWERAA